MPHICWHDTNCSRYLTNILNPNIFFYDACHTIDVIMGDGAMEDIMNIEPNLDDLPHWMEFKLSS